MTLPTTATVLAQITKNGALYKSKPKKADGDAQYVWRMVQFVLSGSGPLACMPVLADLWVEAPEDYMIVAPQDFVEGYAKNQWENPINKDYYERENIKTFEEAVLRKWNKYERRRYYIKNVLDPITDEILKQFKPSQMHGLNRWGRALGMIR